MATNHIFLINGKNMMFRKIVRQLACKATNLLPCIAFSTTQPYRFNQEYSTFEQLGKGSCGIVYRVVENSSQKQFTCKKMRKTKRWRAHREAIALRDISGSRLPQFHAKLEDEFAIYILSKYIPGEDLFDYLADFYCLDEYDLQHVVVEMASCIKQCLDCSIAHLDIKTENFIVDEASVLNLKLIDFGAAHHISEDKELMSLKTPAGTTGFSPPEFYGGRFHRNSDVWSLAVCIWILATGERPFPRHESYSTSKTVSEPGHFIFPTLAHEEKLKTMSPLLVSLLGQMFTIDPRKRISIQEVLSHPWIVNT